MELKKYKIRPLIRRDRKVLAELIKKLVDRSSNDSLLNIIQSGGYSGKEEKQSKEEESKISYIELMHSLLNNMIRIIEEDVTVWFADLINKTVAEYDELPFGIEAMIIEQILESEEVADFFSSASRAYNMIIKLRASYSKQREK